MRESPDEDQNIFFLEYSFYNKQVYDFYKEHLFISLQDVREICTIFFSVFRSQVAQCHLKKVNT